MQNIKSKIPIFLIVVLLVTLPVSACGQKLYSLSAVVNPDGSGSVFPSSAVYDEGTQLELNASPAPGYLFDHWSGDLTGDSNPVTINIDGDKNIVANFKAVGHTLTITVEPKGAGFVVTGGNTYESGTTAEIVIMALPGYRVDDWSGDVESYNFETDNKYIFYVRMDQDKDITVYFTPAYTQSELDQLITQLDSSDEDKRQEASGLLKELGRILSEEQINRLVDMMREGEQSLPYPGGRPTAPGMKKYRLSTMRRMY